MRTETFYDPTTDADARFSVVFNRMSPSAYLRGHGHTILYTLGYLAHLEQLGVRVINGASAFRVETSKTMQLSLLRSLGLPFPAARVINHPPRLTPPPTGCASHRRQAEHRRQRRGNRSIRSAGGSGACRR